MDLYKEIREFCNLIDNASEIPAKSEYMEGYRDAQKNNAHIIGGILKRYVEEKDNDKNV